MRWLLILALSLPSWAATVTTLTVQESTYTGGFSGASRTDETVCNGVALADSLGITSASSFGLTGASAGQFYVLNTWPSGHWKWMAVCAVVPSLTTGSTVTLTLTDTGSGNFGGSDLATDNGTTITVATGTATFTVKKANFNGLDVVDVGTTHLVLTGASKGFRLYGPDPTAAYPGNVTCSPTSGGTDCSVATGTQYTSANDSSSTCSVERNGPVVAVLSCTWTYKDSGGTHSYMTGSARMYFRKNYSDVRIVPVLHNALYGNGAVANTAYKGIQGYQFNTVLNLASGNVTVANHTGTPTTGAISGTDNITLFQGKNTTWQAEELPANPWSSVNGYTIKKNGSTSGLTGTTSGTQTQSPEGWADLDSSGNGLQIGQFRLGPYGDKSLSFTDATTSVSADIGILAPENSAPVYIEYPAWVIESPYGIWLNFHTSAPSLSTVFNKWQTFLLFRQSPADYNAAAVWLYPINTATDEDTYESNNYLAASPATIPAGSRWANGSGTFNTDTACPGTSACPSTTRQFSWALENDYRFDYMMTWIQRGWAARYLEAQSFYTYAAEYAAPHSDGFWWYQHWNSTFTEVDGYGNPKVTVNANNANASLGLHGTGFYGYTNWHDQEHNHWWGMADYYYLSTDETIKDALINEQKNWYLAPNTYQNGGYPGSSTLTYTSGNSTLTKTFGSNWTNTMLGQILLVGSDPNQLAFQVVSVTDTTHVVVTPTPSSSGTNAPFIYGNGLYNSRAFASNVLDGVHFADFLQGLSDSDYSSVDLQMKHLYTIQAKPWVCGSGFPAGCSVGSSVETPAQIAGINPKRGFAWGSAGQSGNWCAYTHTYRVNSAFQTALLAESLIALRNRLGSGWSDYWNAFDRVYGMTKFASTELFINDGGGSWLGNGYRFGVAFDVQNNCQGASDLFTVSTNGTTAVTNVGVKSFAPICPSSATPCSGAGMNPTISPTPVFANLASVNGTLYNLTAVTDANNLTLNTTAPTNASQTMFLEEVDFQTPTNTYNYPLFCWTDWLVTGSTSTCTTQIPLLMQLMQDVSGRTSTRNWLGHEWNTAVHTINNPGTKTLQNLSITSFTDNANGTYTIGWTTPSGTDYLRVKYGCNYPLCADSVHNQIVDWIGFDPATNAFTGTSSNIAWFAAPDATSIPSPVAGSQSMTVTTGVSGMAQNEFSVKAFATTAATVGGSVITGKVTLSGKVKLQ